MIWQDLMFMIGSFIFFVALIPTIRSNENPAIITSALTGSILTIYLICYATMGLWLAFAANLLTAGAWFILLIQRII